MKKATTTLLAMLSVTGLVIAGAEADNFLVQMLACTGGVMLFAASMFGVVLVNRG